MAAVIRAQMRLQPGCRLYYDCPSRGESFEGDQFFNKYRGKYAEFVEYARELVGPLDHKGRMPGSYLHPGGIDVRFEGETEVHKDRNIHHFIVVDTSKATLLNSVDQMRLGDLPSPVLFYPGDMVRFLKKPASALSDGPYEISSVFLKKIFTSGGMPRYDVRAGVAEHEKREADYRALPDKERPIFSSLLVPISWSAEGHDLELVARGNVWKLYHEPEKLSFSSDKEEAKFWCGSGLSYHVSQATIDSVLGAPKRSDPIGYTFAKAWSVFESTLADLVEPLPGPEDNRLYMVKKVMPCFQSHVSRARKASESVWAQEAARSLEKA